MTVVEVGLAYASSALAIGDSDACRQQIEAADSCQARALAETGDPAGLPV